MRSFKYIKNIIRLAYYKALYRNKYHQNIISGLDRVKVEIYNKGKIDIKEKCQSRGELYLISDGGSIEIGAHCFFNTNVCITSKEEIKIGDYSTFGNNVVIVDHDHDYKNAVSGKYKTAKVVIGNNVWVGADVVILQGSKIGNNCVIGAGSLIKDDIPDNVIVVQKRMNMLSCYKKDK